MNSVIKAVSLNVDKENDILPIVKVGKGTNNIKLAITLFANGIVYNIASTVTARIHVKKSDGAEVYSDCSISGNVITAPLTSQSTASEGESILKLQILDATDSTVLYTPACYLIIKAGMEDANIVSSNEFTSLETALKAVGDITNKLDKTGNTKDCTTTFEESQSEDNILDGESQSALFGKIMHKFSLIGKISELNTKVKSSVVNAINSIVSFLGSADITHGGKSTLSEAVANLYSWNPTETTNMKTDALYVDTTKATGDANKPGYVSLGTGGTQNNMPTNCAAGSWHTLWVNSGFITVVIEGVRLDGNLARWSNRYNGSSWVGWQEDLNTVTSTVQGFSKIQNVAKDSATYILGFNGGSDVVGCVPYYSVIAGKVHNPTGSAYMLTDSGSNLLEASQTNVVNTSNSAFSPIFASAFNIGSSKLVKENINQIDLEEAKKLLQLNPITYDYKKCWGGQKGYRGLVAEELETIYPFAVTTPEGYDESKFDEEKGLDNKIKAIDYSSLIPELIKLVQWYGQRLDELEREKHG